MALHAERDPRVSVGSQWVIFLSDGSGQIGQGFARVPHDHAEREYHLTRLGHRGIEAVLRTVEGIPAPAGRVEAGQGNRRQVRGCVADRFKEEKWKAQIVSLETDLT
jgi:hypothetical protein